MSGRGAEATNIEGIVDCVQAGEDATGELNGLSTADQRAFWKEYNDRRSQGEDFQSTPVAEMQGLGRRSISQRAPEGGFNGQCTIPDLTIVEDGHPYEPDTQVTRQLHENDQVAEPVETEDSSFEFLRRDPQERIEEQAQGLSENIGEQVNAVFEDGLNSDAQLSLREQLLRVNDASPEVRAQVMENLEEQFKDESYLPNEAESYVDITYAQDENGNDIKSQPLQVDFYDKFNNGTPSASIDLTKSLTEMAQEAKQRYDDSPNVWGMGTARGIRELNEDAGGMQDSDRFWWDRVLKPQD